MRILCSVYSICPSSLSAVDRLDVSSRRRAGLLCMYVRDCTSVWLRPQWCACAYQTVVVDSILGTFCVFDLLEVVFVVEITLVDVSCYCLALCDV